MSGVLPILDVYCANDATGNPRFGAPKLRSFDNLDADEVEAAVNRLAANPKVLVLGISAIGAVTVTADVEHDGEVAARFFASVIDQNCLTPDGGEGEDSQ